MNNKRLFAARAVGRRAVHAEDVVARARAPRDRIDFVARGRGNARGEIEVHAAVVVVIRLDREDNGRRGDGVARGVLSVTAVADVDCTADDEVRGVCFLENHALCVGLCDRDRVCIGVAPAPLHFTRVCLIAVFEPEHEIDKAAVGIALAAILRPALFPHRNLTIVRDRADSARGARERAELAVGAVARGVFRVNHKRPNRIVARLDGRLERVELGRNALVGVLVAERRTRVVVAHPPALLHDADQARRGFGVIGSEHALDCRDFRLEGRRVDGIIDVERAEQSPLNIVVAARLAVGARLAHESGVVARFPPCRRRARAVLVKLHAVDLAVMQGREKVLAQRRNVVLICKHVFRSGDIQSKRAAHVHKIGVALGLCVCLIPGNDGLYAREGRAGGLCRGRGGALADRGVVSCLFGGVLRVFCGSGRLFSGARVGL